MTRSLHETIGRQAVFDEIASGGMAAVPVGRLLGPVGLWRTVAIDLTPSRGGAAGGLGSRF